MCWVGTDVSQNVPFPKRRRRRRKRRRRGEDGAGKREERQEKIAFSQRGINELSEKNCLRLSETIQAVDTNGLAAHGDCRCSFSSNRRWRKGKAVGSAAARSLGGAQHVTRFLGGAVFLKFQFFFCSLPDSV